MIRVTVELVSARGSSRDRLLGIAQITNDGKRSFMTGGARGDFYVSLSKWAPKHNQVWKRGRIENFDRRRRGPWDLLYLALKNVVGDRNDVYQAGPALQLTGETLKLVRLDEVSRKATQKLKSRRLRKKAAEDAKP